MFLEKNRKFIRLTRILGKIPSVCIAFSGGIDSSFLLRAVVRLSLPRVLAVTAVSDFIPRAQKKEALRYAKIPGVKFVTFKYVPPALFWKNGLNRCYTCKKGMLRRILQIAKKENIPYVVDGSNVDDRKDFRPGRKALQELGVRSPLEEAGLSKKDIRMFSSKMGLKTAKHASGTCLATRIPYGERITLEKLKRIDAAEDFLRELGFFCVRVRSHGTLARIETDPRQTSFLLINKEKITKKLKALGFTYVTIDLNGYKTGSLHKSSHG